MQHCLFLTSDNYAISHIECMVLAPYYYRPISTIWVMQLISCRLPLYSQDFSQYQVYAGSAWELWSIFQINAEDDSLRIICLTLSGFAADTYGFK